MKKLNILLAAALLLALANNAHAQSSIITGKALVGRSGIGADGHMKWVRGSVTTSPATDSTRISIPGAAAATDFADTTAWLDLGAFKFRNDYTVSPLVAFQINRQLTASTDSVGFSVQYTNDITATGIYGSSAAAAIVTVTVTTAGITAGQDGFVGLVSAVAPATATEFSKMADTIGPYRYVRLVVRNSQTAATGRLYFSVQPVIFGSL